MSHFLIARQISKLILNVWTSTELHRWRLQPNPSKTESCVFHLSTHHANRTLDIQFVATQIQRVEHSKYLGVTLDRSLTYNTHLSKTALTWWGNWLAQTGEQALKHYAHPCTKLFSIPDAWSGCCWTAFEPSREHVRTSCIFEGS
jgi:hypothetical protein